jgi:hypothetical protein
MPKFAMSCTKIPRRENGVWGTRTQMYCIQRIGENHALVGEVYDWVVRGEQW